MDYPAAEQSWNSLKDVASTKPGLREQLNGDLAALSLTQGRLAAASTYAAVALSAAVERQQPGDYLLFSSQLARIDLRYRNQPAAALARITSALSRFPLASMDPLDRPYSQLAMLYAEAGKPDEEWGIEQTLAPEQLVAAPAHIAQSEAHHENGWIRRWRPADHGLSVHARRGTVGEAQPLSDMCARQAHLALSQ